MKVKRTVQSNKKYLLILFMILAGAQINSCGANIFSDQQELSMGADFAKEIEAGLKVHDDKKLNSYVDEIGQSLVAISDRKNIVYHFKVIDNDSTINAFAVPGGYIYIYSGLILHTENEAELAGVLAHEIGHVVGKHSMKKMTQLYGFQFILALALGENPNRIADIASQMAVGGVVMKYGRDNEFEADRYGTMYLNQAGYDPDGFRTFLVKLSELGGDKRNASLVENLFSTHPDTQLRIDRVKTLIDGIESRGKRRNSEKFQAMKKNLEKK